MKSIGLIGCGSIATRLAAAVGAGAADARITHVYDSERAAAERLAASMARAPVIAENAHMLSSYPVDIVVEAASQDAVRDHALSVIQNRRDLVVMSAGALLDEAVLDVLTDACAEFGRSIYVPSGAAAGIDALRAVAGQIDEVELTTTKHPSSLPAAERPAGGAGVAFEGSAREAVRRFPRNINVAAVVCLAARMLDGVRVRVLADPDAASNTHEISARGAFGSMSVRVSNVPDELNARTSRLAALSAVRVLADACSRGGVRAGT